MQECEENFLASSMNLGYNQCRVSLKTENEILCQQ